MPITEVIPLQTAEELFERLSPVTGSIFTHHIGFDPAAEWVFRGQANEDDGRIWPLLPKAHRANAFLPFVQGNVGPLPTLTAKDQREEETRHVLRFAEIVDRHGFLVPDDSPDLRDARAGNGIQYDWEEFPPIRLVAMFALAQHYGIPTRLLDWTWKPLVAAYFAAEPVARRREPGKTVPNTEAPFSVFALRREVWRAMRGLDTEIHVISVPTATNPNLNAQGGHFTLVQPRAAEQHPLPTVKEALESQEGAILKRDPKQEHRFPFLIEYRVPASQARTVLMLLSHMGITGAAIYPGLGGAAIALKESRFYQWADVGSRS